jgi:hypothetical protein
VRPRRAGGAELRQQSVRQRGEGVKLVMASRTHLLAAHRVDPVDGPRVGDLHATETLELGDGALDLVAWAEDLCFCHRN